MLIGTVVFALLAGWLKGGKLRLLAEIKLYGIWLIPLALAVQALVYWAAVKGIRLGPSWLAPVLHTASYGLLLIFVLLNFQGPGVRVLGLGILLNAVVIGFNGGLMPVDPAYLPEPNRLALLAGQGTHSLMTEKTSLSFLADRLFLYVPGLRREWFSIGDILIDIGVFVLIFENMTRPRGHRIKSLAR